MRSPDTSPSDGRSARLIHAAQVTPIPWRNGAGVTRLLHTEIGGDEAAPQWTLSLATIEESGPFSLFPGMDRHFVLASKTEFELIIGNERRHLAYTDSAVFPGETAVHTRAVAGTNIALNLMTRRTRCHGDVTIARWHDTLALSRNDATAVVVLGGRLSLAGLSPAEGGCLGRHDAILLGDQPIHLSSTHAEVALIRVSETQDAGCPGAAP